MKNDKPRVTVWNEFRHETRSADVAAVYPDGIHNTIRDGLVEHGFSSVRVATLDEPEHGLSEKELSQTDVLLWWGHMAHDEVDDVVVHAVCERVLAGMGLIVLHSGHHSKPFKRLMGTSCSLRWREDNRMERIWTVQPGHPIADGVGPYFELPQTEMYGEYFDIPTPDNLVFVSWFEGGEVFRSGCCFHRGLGKIFYFRPGHETLPIYKDNNARRVIANAVAWAAPSQPDEPFPYAEGAAIHAENPLS